MSQAIVRQLCFGSCKRSKLHFFSSNEPGHENCIGIPFIPLKANGETFEEYLIEIFNQEHTELMDSLKLRRDGNLYVLHNDMGVPTDVRFIPYNPKSDLPYGGNIEDLKDSQVWMLVPENEGILHNFEVRHQIAVG